MGRLLNGLSPSAVEADRWGIARRASEDWRATVLLKGAATVIATPGETLAVNRSGHPAMAQGGMGDALTGMLAALLGQGVSAHKAALLAAFLHGRAGERAVASESPLAVTAGSLIEHLGPAVRDLLESHSSREGSG